MNTHYFVFILIFDYSECFVTLWGDEIKIGETECTLKRMCYICGIEIAVSEMEISEVVLSEMFFNKAVQL